jgi:hypothetical protein
MTDFILGIVAGVFICIMILGATAAVLSHDQLDTEKCKTRCHPSKAEWLRLTETCLCEVAP